MYVKRILTTNTAFSKKKKKKKQVQFSVWEGKFDISNQTKDWDTLGSRLGRAWALPLPAQLSPCDSAVLAERFNAFNIETYIPFLAQVQPGIFERDMR